jgi:hypothetical protein
VRLTFLVVVLLLAASAAQASPFVNLDFEQANVPAGTGQFISTANAFPGWTARINNAALGGVYHDYDGIGEAAVALYDQPAFDLGIPLLQGSYAALLIGNGGFPPDVASLSQVGDPRRRSIASIARGIFPWATDCDAERRNHSDGSSIGF